ncbi:ribosomal-protein-alanine acetyltransferase [Arthrobacter sp. MN05-02]|nr:ribosomal-protein-alanine acetyltransferase [Arthrobacter sp. MN05-02]
MSHILRDMTFEDIETIGGLEEELFPADAWPVEMFYSEFFQPDTRRYIVAEVDGEAVGYAGLMVLATTADIQTIGVLPRFEGQGIGRAMLTELLDEARRRGADNVMLEVRADNPRAQQLYTRFGFARIHTRKRYYRDGVDAWVMRLVLTTEDGETP